MYEMNFDCTPVSVLLTKKYLNIICVMELSIILRHKTLSDAPEFMFVTVPINVSLTVQLCLTCTFLLFCLHRVNHPVLQYHFFAECHVGHCPHLIRRMRCWRTYVVSCVLVISSWTACRPLTSYLTFPFTLDGVPYK